MLGNKPARGLWGIKHVRSPVDALVAAAKTLPPTTILPLVSVEVSKEGLSFSRVPDKKGEKPPVYTFTVDTISYGVQDLVYTRVFSMIVVKDEDLKNGVPFDCHAFVCESRNQARQLTYALAAAFQEFGRKVKEDNKNGLGVVRKKFAIDLRTPEELEQASDGETDA